MANLPWFGRRVRSFEQCQHFERCDLHGGQLAFTFYDQCAEGFFHGLYVKEVLGEGVAIGHQSYYRVGYCPAVVEGDFIKAKTLLFPGYRGTPEYGVIARARIPADQKEILRQRAKTMDMDQLQRTGDFSLIKMFHDGGVPQVIQSTVPFYAPP